MSVGSTVRRFGRSLARRAELASTRFPVASLFVLVFSAFANAEVADVHLVSRETLGWWIVAVYAAAVAAVVAKLVTEAKGAGRLAGQVASLAAALLVGGVVRYAAPLGVFAPALVVAVSFAVPLAPYVVRPDDRRFWTFTLWSSVGVVLAFLSVLLFTAGVSAILEMVRFLFEVGLGSQAYEHMYTTALTLVGPLIALGRIPADFDETIESTGEDRLAGGVRLLFDWVAAPLALATALVLHLYAAKILSLGELPKNEVGWIVTSFALLVLSLRIGAEPFLANGRTFARLFGRVWAAMLVVPLGLLAVAITQRVVPEGWTLERYYLALGALAAGLIILAQIVPRLRGRIRLMAGIPLALLALSSFGPLGVGDTVGRSQSGRLAALMVDQDGRTSVLNGRSAEARSRIDALSQVDELDRAVALLPEPERAALAAKLEDGSTERNYFGSPARSEAIVAEAFGAQYQPTPEESRNRVFSSALRPPLIATGFDVVLTDRSILPRSIDVAQTGGIGTLLDGGDVEIEVGRTRDRFSLGPAIEAVPDGSFASDASRTAPIDLALTSTAGRVVRFRLQRLSLNAAGQPVDLTATLLLRRQDWPGDALFGGGAEAGVAEPSGAVGERAR